jgi:hypothetical protein
VIDRSTTRDTPTDPMALYLVALLFGTLVAETILASVHVRAHRQAGHMDASDLIKTLQNTLRGGGRPHMGLHGLVMWRMSTAPAGWSRHAACLPKAPVAFATQPRDR